MKYIGIPRQSKSKAEIIQSFIGIGLMFALIIVCVVGAGSLFSDSNPDEGPESVPSDTAELSSIDVQSEPTALEHRSSDETIDMSLPFETETDIIDDDDMKDQDTDDEDDLTLTCFEVEEIADYYATGTLNIRSGPGVDYDEVGEFSFGDIVSVIATTDNGWKKIADDQYVIAEFLSTQIPEQAHTGTYYATGDINVRSGPGTEYDITRELSSGSPVSVVAITSNGWYRTAVDTYVYAELCTSTPPATPTPIATPTPTRAPTPTPIPIPPGVAEQAATVGLSPEEFEFMARVVEAETTSNYDGKVWVARVIWNRIQSNRWPNSVNRVLIPGQFCVVTSPGVCDTPSTSASREAVVDAYLNRPIPRYIYYFCTPAAYDSSSFFQSLEVYDEFAGHMWCYSEDHIN